MSDSSAPGSIAPGQRLLDVDMMLAVARFLNGSPSPQVLSLRAWPERGLVRADYDAVPGDLDGLVVEFFNATERGVRPLALDPAAGIRWSTPPARLSLLVAGLEWLRADVVKDEATFRRLLHPDAEMFGERGAEAILAQKQRWLTNLPAYYIPAVAVDEVNGVVSCEFECLLEGREGRGTDFIFFDSDLRVRRVTAVRHAGGEPWRGH